MTSDVIYVRPDTAIDDARNLMRSQRVRHLPVIDEEGAILGLISIGDLNAHYANNQEVEIHYLQEYLHGRV